LIRAGEMPLKPKTSPSRLCGSTQKRLIGATVKSRLSAAAATSAPLRPRFTGQVYINEYFAGGIEVPFGGNRKSGFGREKGMEGIKSYCKLKSVVAKI
jgi:hypothetical protein